jgi:lysozyme
MNSSTWKGAAFGGLAACLALTASFEGMYPKPYRDMVGVLTVCYGETEGVKLTDHYTPQQCADMLAAKLPRYWSEISQCIKVPISDNERAAYTSFAYNVGSAGFCRSTTARKLNAGDHKGACQALMAWNRAGGREVRGLTRRRAAERDLCLKGL